MDIPFYDSQKKELIAEFMHTYGKINTIYDLLLIPDLTASDIDQLKTYIFIGRENSESMYSSLDNNSYEYGNYLGEDGSMSNASQYWLDMILIPEDINKMNYFEENDTLKNIDIDTFSKLFIEKLILVIGLNGFG